MDKRNGKIINNKLEEFKGFPDSLNDEIFLEVDKDGNINTRYDYSLKELKERKKNMIRERLKAENKISVVVKDVFYHSGYESVMRLNAAKQFAKDLGLKLVTFTDIDNNEHELSLSDAMDVVLTIWEKYKNDFLQKQSLMRAIDKALDVVQLDKVIWK